jgi:hypothetical protein
MSISDTNTTEVVNSKSLRANITIFISLTSYLRNWIGAGAFEQLENTYNVTYLMPEHDWDPSDICNFTKCKFVVIKQSEWRMKLFRLFMQISMVSASKRSEAFRIKISYWNGRLRIVLSIFKSNLVFGLLSKMLVWFMPNWPELAEYISITKPDLFIAPSLLADSFTMDLALIAKRSGVKTIILVNSWDNLISKGTVPFEVDHLVVWGAKSIKHANYVQRIGTDKISVLGVPRFERYFKDDLITSTLSRDKDYIYDFNSIDKSKKIILYPATALPFDDIRALALIDNEISINAELFEYIVLYRPHPETFPRLSEKYFFDQNYQNVVMDQQMVSYYRNRFGAHEGKHVASAINITDLDYYPKLLRTISCVVCPATTMTLEALLCGKPVVMVCYDDGLNKWLPPSEVARYENVQELMELPGVFTCKEEESLIPLLHESIEMSLRPNTSQIISDSTINIVYRDSDPYTSRLLRLVSNMV